MDELRETIELDKDKIATFSSTVDSCCQKCNNEAIFECILCLKNGNKGTSFCSRSCYEQHFHEHRISNNSSKSSSLSPRSAPFGSDASSSSCPDSPLYDWMEQEQRRLHLSKTWLNSGYHHHQFPDYWNAADWTQTASMINNTMSKPKHGVPLVRWMPLYNCWIMYP
eukprot:g3279.t1